MLTLTGAHVPTGAIVLPIAFAVNGWLGAWTAASAWAICLVPV